MLYCISVITSKANNITESVTPYWAPLALVVNSLHETLINELGRLQEEQIIIQLGVEIQPNTSIILT